MTDSRYLTSCKTHLAELSCPCRNKLQLEFLRGLEQTTENDSLGPGEIPTPDPSSAFFLQESEYKQAHCLTPPRVSLSPHIVAVHVLNWNTTPPPKALQ